MRLTKIVHLFKKHDEILKWLIDADLTYCSGRYLLISDEFFFRTSGGYLLHQAAEKYLKTLRKVLRPQVNIEKHGHELMKILKDIKSKGKTLLPENLKEPIKKINEFEKFRYVDLEATTDIETMGEGLRAIDYLVVSVRKAIEEKRPDITERAIKRYIEGIKDKEDVLNLLIDSLLNKSSCAKYWIKHFSEIDVKIDCKLKKYQSQG
ncbi:hypothetical protein BMS3Abin07_00857 [bacterium BMS3Abin07]|nr:hypothetical protein BMS3Abin07_00857 [bacterium BMS3Abin07]GBE33048.1 hypothetical protein BMS3Bbin05_01980 [bacterium BMS3Bbin05]